MRPGAIKSTMRRKITYQKPFPGAGISLTETSMFDFFLRSELQFTL